MTNAVHFNSFEVDLQLCFKHFQAETMCCDTFMESQVYEKDGSVQQKNLNYVPGLYKIFDEILVNAADNFVRDNSQTYVKVTINEKDGFVTVENNGHGLPVEEHKEHKMYVPELVFGHLLTSDNYDDTEKKANLRLTNIFSKKFEIECGDAERKKKYHQIWEGNMQTKQKPKITSHSGESFTKITFWPDLTRFGMKKLDKDIVGLMSRRVVDLAGTTPAKCKIFLNGKRLDISNFKDYIQLYTGTEDVQIVHEKCHERWEVAMTVSFVNNIATPKGGTHVVHVADQLVEVNKQNKGGMEIKPYHVRNYLWIFVNAQIENPSFDSQTKETLTLKAAKFGSSCHIPDKMIEKVLKTGIVDMVLQWARAKEEIDLGKTMKGGSSAPNKKTKRLLNIPKLEDANLAGGRDGRECTLILTEGDSAKSLAVAGLGVIGRDRYGVFPLRGKILNVLSISGESMVTLNVSDSMCGCDLWNLILDEVPTKPGLQLVVSHTSRLVLNESLKQQGLGGQRAHVSATYIPVNLLAALHFALGDNVEDEEFSLNGITKVTDVSDEMPALLLNLPKSLQTLTFAERFNQEIHDIGLPAGLQRLIFQDDFNQSLDNVKNM
eukprot:symbB.v1.2.015289.t1/scaffold1134.1/size135964/1